MLWRCTLSAYEWTVGVERPKPPRASLRPKASPSSVVIASPSARDGEAFHRSRSLCFQ
jgi:hypothetical protein